MAGFDASTVVTALDYNFAPFVKAKGVTPEPTDAQIEEFLRGIQDVMKEATGILPDADTSDPAAMLSALGSMEPEKVTHLTHGMAKVYGKLCSDKPSADDLLGLPLRVRVQFFAYIQQEVISPEAGPGAGTQLQQSQLRAVAG
jgi:hypothetical protein